jgi:hypothetical protein
MKLIGPSYKFYITARGFQLQKCIGAAAQSIDKGRRIQEDILGRPETIRRLVEIGLKAK